MAPWIFSFLLGAIAVFQAGLNRQIMSEWGLPSAVLLNSFVLIIFASLFWFAYHFYPHLLPVISDLKNSSGFKWYWVLPGLCGFLLVAGIPFAIPKLGASGVFLCVVVGQMFFSLLWDLKFEGIAIEPKRLLGMGLAVAGLFITWKA